MRTAVLESRDIPVRAEYHGILDHYADTLGPFSMRLANTHIACKILTGEIVKNVALLLWGRHRFAALVRSGACHPR